MARLFADLPGAVEGAFEIAQQLEFGLDDLGYRFPEFSLPPGESPDSWLHRLAWEGARSRFRPLSARAQAQIEKELRVIEKLGLAGYFLIVREIVEFCRREAILVQGRGSAANSAVCYALSITAVDPVRMELLFERFLSEERGEWPDIDLDLPSGPQREKVIQHVYSLYGPHGAAMTANVITWRDRSAAREVGKALGYSAEQLDRLSKALALRPHGPPRPGSATPRGDVHSLPLAAEGASPAPAGGRSALAAFADAGLDPDEPRARHFLRLFRKIQNLPRHLGQHSGGMVVAAGRLDEVVPLEPAAMPGRLVVQWDKDDCADLGIVKIDLLGLGMLAAIEEAIPSIRATDGVDIDLAHLPSDDPETWRMIREADTVGVFQLESRAQMASLPRHAPSRFYDLAVQVAIIRPGPIGGGLMQKFFDRRAGREATTPLHPSLEPVLARTLGVPIFQEQILRMAMVAAGFSGGEAEELRRAMGFKRSVERMEAIESRLRSGMTERGILGADQDEIVRWITAFAMYGFPESHAASFALIAWASAYLRAHHPACYLAALLNAWPMGFYHPSTLVEDARRHGVEVLPIDVDRSGWKCRPESGGVRLGFRFVAGLREETARRIEEERAAGGAFSSIDDLVRRSALRKPEVDRLAELGALASFGLTRRAALWQAARAVRPVGPLFASQEEERDLPPSPLPEMSPLEETAADYGRTGITTGPHLMAHFREQLRAEGIATAAEVAAARDGERIAGAGVVIVRQHPATAKGFVFLAIEDETGMYQAILRPDLFEANRPLVVSAPALVVEGRVQKQEGTLSLRVDAVRPLSVGVGRRTSHDFR
jgi:error-prone DNA polymerase